MRRIRTLTALAIATTVLAGCSSQAIPSASTGGGEPVAGGSLVFGDVQPVQNAQTQRASNYSVANLLGQIQDRLTFVDPESDELVPWIAESWEQDASATRFVFQIRDGVTFSNGEPLDAAAVAANLELLGHGDEEQGIPANGAFVGFERAEATGPLETTVTFSTPNTNFLRSTAGATAGLISPSTIALDGAGQNDIEQIVGSGPFVFASQVVDQEIRLERRDDYAWPPASSANQGAAHLDEVVFTVLAEVGLRAGAVSSGQVDVARGIQPTDEAPLTASGIEVVPTRTTELTANFLAVRIAQPAVEDVAVRQALQIGFDREQLAQTVLSDGYEPAASILPHGAPGFVDLSSELAYDPERAAELLDDAGWVVADDGIRVRDGVRLTVTVAASNQSVVFRPAIEFVAQQWLELGIEVDNRAGDTTFATAAGQDPTVTTFGTRLFMNGGIGPIFAPEGNIWTYAVDEEFNDLYAAELAATDEAARLEAVEAQQRRVVLENPRAIVLWDETQVQALAPGVHVEFTGGDAPLLQSAWVDR